MLVFERDGDLHRMAVDGSETLRLTATKALEGDPAVSADGLTVAFTRGTARRHDELWTSDLQGRGQRRIVSARPARMDYASTDDPVWSPDGRSIYLARAAQGPNEICGWIYRVGADGRGLRRVTRGVGIDFRPAPSPDGLRLAYVSGACEPGAECCAVRVVDLAGRPTGDLRRLRQQPLWEYRAITWSPDGLRVAILVHIDAATVRREVWSIYVANSDGSGLRRVTPQGIGADEPAWSPDGEWIAFSASTRSTGSDLYVTHPDGTGLQRLTRTKADELSPSWVPRS